MAERMTADQSTGPRLSGVFQRLTTGNLMKDVWPYIPETHFYQQDPITEVLQGMEESTLKFSFPILSPHWIRLTKYHYEKKVFTIGVFGRHKAGKSTLINALLHQSILPSATENETAALMKIVHDPTKHYSKCSLDSCEKCPVYYHKDEQHVQSGKKVCKKIRVINKEARQGKLLFDDLDNHVLKACIPSFMQYITRFSQNDISVMLLDTPGLAEANIAKFTEMSEYYLMTCSAYIYVISCTQIQDEVDQEALEAIRNRDPDVFQDKRLIIAVTRLDDYQERKDGDDDENDSDDGDDDGHPKLTSSIQAIKESIIKQCGAIGIAIPEDCIVPVFAKAALECREGTVDDIFHKSLLKKNFNVIVEADKIVDTSQVPILEERIGDILDSVQRTWKAAIIKDCKRYSEKMLRKIEEVQHDWQKHKEDLEMKVNEKDAQYQKIQSQKKEMIEAAQNIQVELSKSFDEDMMSKKETINELIEEKLNKFAKQIKDRRMTLDEYHSDLKSLVAESNQQLKESFCGFEFAKLNDVIFNFQCDQSERKSQFISCCDAFCEVAMKKEDFKNIKNKPVQSIREDVSKQIENEADDQSPPLTFEDLLMKTGTIEHNVIKQIWKKIKE
jgi:GTPase SAR1 family protein